MSLGLQGLVDTLRRKLVSWLRLPILFLPTAVEKTEGGTEVTLLTRTEDDRDKIG